MATSGPFMNVKNEPVQASERFIEEFDESVSAPEVLKDLEKTVKKYHGAAPDVNQLLSSTRMPDSQDEKDPSLSQILKDADDKAAVKTLKTSLTTLLADATQTTSPKIATTLKSLETDCQLLSQWANEKPPRIRIQDVPAQIARLESEALTEIDRLQKDQQHAIDTAFQGATTLKNDVKEAFGCADDEAETLTEHLQKAANKKITDDQEAFKKAVQEIEDKVTKHLVQERARIAYLHTVSRANIELQNEINTKVAARHTQAGTNPQATADIYDKIVPEECKNLVTVMGAGIRKKGDSYELVSPGLSFGKMFEKIKNFFGGDKQKDSDLLSLVAFFRTKNCDRITLTINNCEDREEAVKYAQKCYKACQLCGYSDDQINIVWPNTDNRDKKEEQEVLIGEDVKNTSDKKPPRIKPEEKVFQGANESDPKDLLGTIRRKGEQVRKELAASIQSKKTAQQLKGEFDALRKTHTASTQAAQQAATQPQGGTFTVRPTGNSN